MGAGGVDLVKLGMQAKAIIPAEPLKIMGRFDGRGVAAGVVVAHMHPRLVDVGRPHKGRGVTLQHQHPLPCRAALLRRIQPIQARTKDDFIVGHGVFLRSAVFISRVIFSRQGFQQYLHQVAVAFKAADLGGGLAGGGVGTGHGDLAGLHAQLRGADAQIRQQLVPPKHVPQGAHVGMGQVLAAVSAVGVGGIGEPLVRPQADERRMHQPHGGVAHRRGRRG